MPDILIDDTVESQFNRTCYSRYVVGVDQDIHYVIFLRGSDLEVRKSVDGGATWNAPVEIQPGVVIKFNVWYDRWGNSSDSGTLIHIILLVVGAPGSLSYYTLDTTDDTISAETVIDTPVVSGGQYTNNGVAISKAHGGNLLLQYWGDLSGSRGCWRSVDAGATWVERTDGADGNAVDLVMMFPGNESDDQDMWMIYLDASSNELSLKTYDDSANSWSEMLITSGIAESGNFWQYAGVIRHLDSHLLITVWNITDQPTSDILTFDINGSGSIDAKGNVVTNLAESGNSCLTINQQKNHVYAGYNKGGVFGATVDAVYNVSEDGMSSWGAEQAMSENAPDDYVAISSTLSIGNVGGKFLPVWFNTDLNDLFCNVNNAVSVNPFVPPPPSLPEYGQIIMKPTGPEYGQAIGETDDAAPQYGQVIAVDPRPEYAQEFRKDSDQEYGQRIVRD